MQQLLWIETLLKLSAGLLLILAPRTTIKIFGLTPAESGFWPRLLGAVLIGIAGAIYLEGGWPGSGGLGLGGCVIVNLSAVSMMLSLLVLEAGPPSARGRGAMWGIVILLVGLSILEVVNL